MNTTNDVNMLRQKCPLPKLMELVGLGRNAQAGLWCLFQYQGRWMYRDYARAELGDEIGLLSRLHKLDPHKGFKAVLKIYQDLVQPKAKGNGTKKVSTSKEAVRSSASAPKTTLCIPELGCGTYEQIEKLSQLKGISVEGLFFAQERRVLAFGEPWGFEVYAVVDQSRRLAEFRVLNGSNFGAAGGLPVRAGHILNGSQIEWPLGMMEAKDCEYIALATGCIEFLTLHQYVVNEHAQGRVAPVAMLCPAHPMSADALPHFKGKHVRIYPCLGNAGLEAGKRWQKQLLEAGAKKVEFLNFAAFKTNEGRSPKDLCEFNRFKLGGSDFVEERILP